MIYVHRTSLEQRNANVLLQRNSLAHIFPFFKYTIRVTDLQIDGFDSIMASQPCQREFLREIIRAFHVVCNLRDLVSLAAS